MPRACGGVSSGATAVDTVDGVRGGVQTSEEEEEQEDGEDGEGGGGGGGGVKLQRPEVPDTAAALKELVAYTSMDAYAKPEAVSARLAPPLSRQTRSPSWQTETPRPTDKNASHRGRSAQESTRTALSAAEEQLKTLQGEIETLTKDSAKDYGPDHVFYKLSTSCFEETFG
jgi:hypothetical protein